MAYLHSKHYSIIASHLLQEFNLLLLIQSSEKSILSACICAHVCSYQCLPVTVSTNVNTVRSTKVVFVVALLHYILKVFRENI